MALKFKHTLNVRWRDADGLAHTNNSVYFTYFEEARLAYIIALQGGLNPDIKRTFNFIVAHAECDFKSPSYVGEKLDVYMGVTRMKNASFIMDYEVKSQKDNRLVACGSTVLVTYDYVKNKVIPISPEMRQSIENFEKSL